MDPSGIDKVRRYEERALNTKRMSKWSRRIQIFTWFSIGTAVAYMVLFNEYETKDGRDHVFSAPQRWVKEQQRKYLGIGKSDESPRRAAP